MSNTYGKIIRENIEALVLLLAERLLNLHLLQVENISDELPITLERKPDFLKKVITQQYPKGASCTSGSR